MILVDQKKGVGKIEGYADELTSDIMIFEEALLKANPRAYAFMYVLMLKRSIEEDGILENAQKCADILSGRRLGA